MTIRHAFVFVQIWVRTAVPPVVFPQLTATPAGRQITQAVPSARTAIVGRSVARKHKRYFGFHVVIWSA
jgi:hypothetical protein